MENEKTKIIYNLMKFGYSKYCTFLYYPNISDDGQKGKVKKIVKLSEKENIYKNIDEIKIQLLSEYNNNFNKNMKSKFLKNIKYTNSTVFLGENAAERYNIDNKKDDQFQVMHDTSNKSQDYKIARLLRDFDKEHNDVKLSGSFAFDLLNGIIATNLDIKMVNQALDIVEKNLNLKFESKVINLKKMPVVSFSKLKYLNDKLELLKDKRNIRYEQFNENYKYGKIKGQDILKEKIDFINKRIFNLNNIIDSEKQILVKEISKHIIKYDLVIFKYLITEFSPKKVICFGKNTFNLAKRFDKICHTNLYSNDEDKSILKQISHYSRTISQEERMKELEKIF